MSMNAVLDCAGFNKLTKKSSHAVTAFQFASRFHQRGQMHLDSPGHSPASTAHNDHEPKEPYENNSYCDSFRIFPECIPVNAADLTGPGCRAAGRVRKLPELRSYLHEVGDRGDTSHGCTVPERRSRSEHHSLYRRCGG